MIHSFFFQNQCHPSSHSVCNAREEIELVTCGQNFSMIVERLDHTLIWSTKCELGSHPSAFFKHNRPLCKRTLEES
ncbi:hypothetical protein GOP47_0012748 [Adiantum capillus-veneris]|uniref:Uncharacterized protein n=1 Tax=Adiantum capillus-veneris TaxID=13818 RepID=A0A9D4USD0_ADICA|nr:hypothetical protein GOP47_0012748 [Adiantum capillus-veneris]